MPVPEQSIYYNIYGTGCTGLQETTMNANEITFGVEIETIAGEVALQIAAGNAQDLLSRMGCI